MGWEGEEEMRWAEVVGKSVMASDIMDIYIIYGGGGKVIKMMGMRWGRVKNVSFPGRRGRGGRG